MVLPDVPSTTAVPEPTLGVVALMVTRQEGLVVLLRAVLLPKATEGVRVPTSADAHAANAPIMVRVGPSRPAIAITKPGVAGR